MAMTPSTNPLIGKRIVITRAAHQSQPLADLLQQHHAIPVLFPCIAIAPPDDTAELDTCLQSLTSYDWLLFTSPNTVRIVADRFSVLNMSPDWSKTQVGVVGSKTSSAFQQHFSQTPDFSPETFTGESLAETLPIQLDDAILLPQSDLADETVASILQGRGAQVNSVMAYQNTIGEGGADVPAMLRRDEIDFVTFTSPSTVHNFIERIHPLQAFHIPAVCIGPTTGDAAHEIGFTKVIVPSVYTLKGMINALITQRLP